MHLRYKKISLILSLLGTSNKKNKRKTNRYLKHPKKIPPKKGSKPELKVKKQSFAMTLAIKKDSTCFSFSVEIRSSFELGEKQCPVVLRNSSSIIVLPIWESLLKKNRITRQIDWVLKCFVLFLALFVLFSCFLWSFLSFWEKVATKRENLNAHGVSLSFFFLDPTKSAKVFVLTEKRHCKKTKN